MYTALIQIILLAFNQNYHGPVFPNSPKDIEPKTSPTTLAALCCHTGENPGGKEDEKEISDMEVNS